MIGGYDLCNHYRSLRFFRIFFSIIISIIEHGFNQQDVFMIPCTFEGSRLKFNWFIYRPIR